MNKNGIGAAVAEWSKVLLQSEEKINENQKIPGLHPSPGTFKKTFNSNNFQCCNPIERNEVTVASNTC